MEDDEKTSFIFEIDNFSEKKAPISSPIFTIGRCQWVVKVYPKRYSNNDYAVMYLDVANTQSLRLGWKRKTFYSLAILNESGKQVYGSFAFNLFCTEVLASHYPQMFDEEVCVVNNKLIVKVDIKFNEVVHYGDETSMEMLEFNGFHILQTQVSSVKRIFEEHPEVAVGFKPKSQLVKTAYMNVLLDLIETLEKQPLSLFLIELNKAESDFTELTEAGFKLDWLKSKLDRHSLLKWFETGQVEVKLDVDVSQIQQVEGCVENLDQMELDSKMESALKKKPQMMLIYGNLVQKLEERVKNLELKEMDFKLDCLKSKLAEVFLEKIKTSDDANRSRVEELEERFKNLELIIGDLKVELDNKKPKSCDDGFLLVN